MTTQPFIATDEPSRRITFADAVPGDLYWSMVDGDWHVIVTVEYLPNAHLGDTYRLTCAGTVRQVIAAGGPRATLAP